MRTSVLLPKDPKAGNAKGDTAESSVLLKSVFVRDRISFSSSILPIGRGYLEFFLLVFVGFFFLPLDVVFLFAIGIHMINEAKKTWEKGKRINKGLGEVLDRPAFWQRDFFNVLVLLNGRGVRMVVDGTGLRGFRHLRRVTRDHGHAHSKRDNNNSKGQATVSRSLGCG